MGSVSGNPDDRSLNLFEGFEVPPINDGIVELTFKSSKLDGYARALAWPIYERADAGGGKVMYYMIHATDHEEAPKLMNRAYKGSTKATQPMDHLQLGFEGAGFDRDIAAKYQADS